MATNFPNSPSNGDTHVFGGTTYTYNSTKGVWNSSASSGGGGASVTTDDTAPSSPSDGDLWWDSAGGKMYVYYQDADSSQWVSVSVPGSAGPAGADASPTSYTNFAGFPSSGNTLGDFAIAQDTKALYVWDGAEWDRIAAGSDESPVILTEPPTSQQRLNSDGSTSTVTMTAQDPEGFTITYGIAYNTSDGSRPLQLATDTSINQNTGVFTFNPTTTESNAGTFKARLSASDGVKMTTRTVDFELAFFPAASNLIARYDVGDANSVTGTSTSWPDTSGNNAAAATINHNSGDGTVETGTYTGVTVLNGSSVNSQNTEVTIPTSVTSSQVTIGLIYASVSNGNWFAFSSHTGGTPYMIASQDGSTVTALGTGGGSLYVDGVSPANRDELYHRIKDNDATKQQQFHSFILDGATQSDSYMFNGYNSTSIVDVNFELRAIVFWDRSLTAQEREDFHNYYSNLLGASTMATWAG